MKKTSFKGFTLAEVLVTLGIIGVVAALTIPNLAKHYQNQQYLTALKKFYTTSNAVLTLMAADSGCPGDLGCISETGTDNLEKEFMSHFKVAKNCQKSFGAGCWPTRTFTKYDATPGDATVLLDRGIFYSFATIDGMSVSVDLYDTCTYSPASTGPMKKLCGAAYVDVNGTKAPNRYGRDTFMFFITGGTAPMLYPQGGKFADGINFSWLETAKTCTSDNTEGFTCAARIIEQGWKMNY